MATDPADDARLMSALDALLDGREPDVPLSDAERAELDADVALLREVEALDLPAPQPAVRDAVMTAARAEISAQQHEQRGGGWLDWLFQPGPMMGLAAAAAILLAVAVGGPDRLQGGDSALRDEAPAALAPVHEPTGEPADQEAVAMQGAEPPADQGTEQPADPKNERAAPPPAADAANGGPPIEARPASVDPEGTSLEAFLDGTPRGGEANAARPARAPAAPSQQRRPTATRRTTKAFEDERVADSTLAKRAATSKKASKRKNKPTTVAALAERQAPEPATAADQPADAVRSQRAEEDKEAVRRASAAPAPTRYESTYGGALRDTSNRAASPAEADQTAKATQTAKTTQTAKATQTARATQTAKAPQSKDTAKPSKLKELRRVLAKTGDGPQRRKLLGRYLAEARRSGDKAEISWAKKELAALDQAAAQQTKTATRKRKAPRAKPAEDSAETSK
jgi:hypothetical protein